MPEGAISSGGGAAGASSAPASASVQGSTPSNGASPTTGGSPGASGASSSPAPASNGVKNGAQQPTPDSEWRYKDKFKAKNGAENEVEYTREELRRKIQIANAQEEGFRALKAEREKFAAQQRALQSQNEGERLEALRAMGVDVDGLARERLAKLARLELMTPEQRAAFEADEKAKAAEARAAKLEADIKARTEREQEKQLWEQYLPQFQAELATHDIPLEPWTMDLLANVAAGFNDAELDANPAMMVSELNRRLDGIFTQRLKKMSIETLEKRLGEDTLKKLFARRASAVKGQAFQQMQGEAKAPSTTPAQKKREYTDPDEFLAWSRSQRR